MGKPKLGPYAIFVREQRRVQPGWSNKSDPELFKLADPLWIQLSEEERSIYVQKAKEYKETGSWSDNNNYISSSSSGQTVRGYDTLGRPLEEIAKRDQDRRDKVMSKSDAIYDIVRRGHEDGGEPIFTLAHANIFVRTPDKNEFVPAEIALLRFSIEGGILDTIQFFPKPGKIPDGYKYSCMEKSDLSHKIPLEAPLKDGTDLERTLTEAKFTYTSDQVIISSIKKFLNGTETVFCMPEIDDNVQGVLDSITSRSGQPRMKVTVLELPELLFILAGHDMIPTPTMAQLEFERERFQYHQDLGCDWHEEETDTNKCSLSFVHRWAFTVLGFTNIRFDVDKVEGQHVPFGTLKEKEEGLAEDAWDDVEESASEYQSSKSNYSSIRTKGSTWGKEGSFASEDIRYKDSDKDMRGATCSMSGLSVKDIMEAKDFDSEYDLPPSGSSVCSFSVKSSPPDSARSSINGGAGRGALLNKLKDNRKSRIVANLKD